MFTAGFNIPYRPWPLLLLEDSFKLALTYISNRPYLLMLANAGARQADTAIEKPLALLVPASPNAEPPFNVDIDILKSSLVARHFLRLLFVETSYTINYTLLPAPGLRAVSATAHAYRLHQPYAKFVTTLYIFVYFQFISFICFDVGVVLKFAVPRHSSSRSAKVQSLSWWSRCCSPHPSIITISSYRVVRELRDEMGESELGKQGRDGREPEEGRTRYCSSFASWSASPCALSPMGLFHSCCLLTSPTLGPGAYSYSPKNFTFGAPSCRSHCFWAWYPVSYCCHVITVVRGGLRQYTPNVWVRPILSLFIRYWYFMPDATRVKRSNDFLQLNLQGARSRRSPSYERWALKWLCAWEIESRIMSIIALINSNVEPRSLHFPQLRTVLNGIDDEFLGFNRFICAEHL